MKKETKVLHLNSNKENLTPEKLKTFSGCEGLSDQEASDTVFAIHTFANILYELITQQAKANELKKAA